MPIPVSVLLLLLALSTSCQKAPVTVLDEAETHFRFGRWESVVEACDQQLMIDPKNPQALSLRGRARIAMKEYVKAIEDLTLLIELNPEDCDPLYRRGIAYEALGQTELARDDKARARSLDPMRESAYVYAPGNFIEKPYLGDASDVSDEGSDVESESPDDRLAEQAQEKSERDEMNRDLEQDFYEREAQAEETAAAATESQLPDSFPSSARRRIRYGDLDEDYVRGAVKSYRAMVEDERQAAANQPRISRPISPSSNVTLDDLLGPDPQTKRDQEQVVEDEAEETQRLNSPVSTALPPGFLNGPPSARGYSSLPYGSRQQPNATNFRSPGALGLPRPIGSVPGVTPGATPSPYQLQGNPIYTPNANAGLSTSLPAGSLGLPALGGLPTTTTPGLPATSGAQRLPSMLPPASDKAGRLDPVP